MVSFKFSLATTGLLLLSNQVDLINGAALPEAQVQMMNRRDWYQQMSDGIVDFHRNNVREHKAEIAARRKQKRQSYDFDWEPDRTFSSGSSGHHAMYATSTCSIGGNKKIQWTGVLVRTITFPVESQRQYMWWLNRTTEQLYTPPGSGVTCYKYAQPRFQYHQSNGNSQMCKDWIWFKTSKTWAERSSTNANEGWTTGNVTYGGQKVRTIWDCHLQQVAVEYDGDHPEIGYEPIRYEREGLRYFRFYDANQFAWFLMCPPEWTVASKRSLNGETALEENALKKRQWGNYNGNNPIWDFMGERWHHPGADNTPLQWFRNGLDDYADQVNKAGYEYETGKIYTINYWPPSNWRNITVEGRQCTQLAVSRPGLRHWTVRFFDNPAFGWPQKTGEWGYPSNWTDTIVNSESASKSSNAP